MKKKPDYASKFKCLFNVVCNYAKLVGFQFYSKNCGPMLFLPYVENMPMKAILEYARDVANGCPDRNPINRAIFDIKTKCEQLSDSKFGQVRARHLYGILYNNNFFNTD